jgi:hypothetical protein
MTIDYLFFYPPLAFGRLGGSSRPLECFYWGEDDNTPRGTGKTTVVPGRTLVVGDDGSLSDYLPNEITFKDSDQFRPVCPFFELHAGWTDAQGERHEEPVTEALLDAHGHKLKDLVWNVSVANLKPYNMSQSPGTRIEASVTIGGDDVSVHELRGVGPQDAPDALVPAVQWIPLGSVRLTRPNAAFPELRLRFTPAKGLFYGPTNLKDRWQGVDLDDRLLFLNKDSPWCSWQPKPDDARGTPGGQYAQDEKTGVSYGMVDDVCDGIITCRLGDTATLTANARITVGPPDFAPYRRHLVSLADGLKDRVDRADVFDAGYYGDDDLCDAEIHELLQRIYETAALNNVDVFNNRVNVQENPTQAQTLGLPYRPMEYIAFPVPDPLVGRPLPLSDLARDNHRRLQVLTTFIELIRRNPSLLPSYVRKPLDANLFFDYRMPAVMRGSSGDPLALTRRQYEFLMRWAKLRGGNEPPPARARRREQAHAVRPRRSAAVRERDGQPSVCKRRQPHLRHRRGAGAENRRTARFVRRGRGLGAARPRRARHAKLDRRAAVAGSGAGLDFAQRRAGLQHGLRLLLCRRGQVRRNGAADAGRRRPQVRRSPDCRGATGGQSSARLHGRRTPAQSAPHP